MRDPAWTEEDAEELKRRVYRAREESRKPRARSMTDPLRFRVAVESDAPAIVRLVNAAYRGTEGVKGWTTEEHLVEGMRVVAPELLEMMRGSHFELALEGEAIVGSVHLRREGSSCYLGMLSVDPGRQTAGIGRALLDRGEEIARGWGCERMRITVLDVRKELLAYYGRRGYRPTGRAFDFPKTDRSHLKVPGIRLLEMEKPLTPRDP